ncbi:efflux transporter outer membrane subunit [Dyella terrae]|uniref:Efflux transporter outer membrane subunit n=3 Tax=Rhodanobacteraceae TaxID=1775411 RepID=A0A4R0Z1S8_9GAMM|nr:efflux transporter outer membrane subunit [Dyella terrae]TCI13759.1 efflux transporter outer membrane subunit [Dyella soli]
MRRHVLLTCILVSLMAGCAVGPDYHRPEVTSPESYRFADPNATSSFNAEWWHQFNDPVLDQLVSKAVAQNKDLAIATARIDEYRGRVMETSSQLYPQIGLGASGGRQRNAATKLTPNYETSQVQVAAAMSWEIDLFGRLRRLRESAKADLLSTEFARQGTLVSLEASVASAYITLRDLDQRLVIAQATVATRLDALNLFQERFAGGVVSQVQLSQAESEYAVAQTSESAIAQQIAQQENAISLLLGENPGPIPRGKSIDQISLPAIPAGLPSALLQQRPDIQEAEQNLVSANAQIGAARAQYFPVISLTGLLGRASTGLGSLWSGPAKMWSYAGAISQPIFTGGAIRGSVHVAEARQQQALFAYQAAIQNAFADVDNALVGEQRSKEQLVSTNDQVKALGQYASLSRDLYEGGYTSYLEVLDAERSLFNAQLTQSGLQAQQLIEVINVYKALGYGWPAGKEGLADDRPQ